MKYDVLCPFAFAKSRLHGICFLCGNRADNVGGFECASYQGHLVCSSFFVIFIISSFRISLIVLSLFLFIVCDVFAPF
jgi:hypothetical protein